MHQLAQEAIAAPPPRLPADTAAWAGRWAFLFVEAAMFGRKLEGRWVER